MSDAFKCQKCQAQLPAYVAHQSCPECGSSLDLPDNNPVNELASPPSTARAENGSPSSDIDQRVGKGMKQRASRTSKMSERDFGDFRLIDEISQGPMGILYRAKHTKQSKMVALKIIDSQHLETELETDRFAIEAAACAALDHPGIVPVLEFGKFGNQHFVAMEQVDGLTLDEILNDGPLSNEDALDMIHQITSAVRYAHQRDVIHRRLEPSNIWVESKASWSEDDPNSYVRVTDFGMARQTDRQSHANVHEAKHPDSVSQYLSPEQIIEDWTQGGGKRRDQGVGAAADIYSIGAVLYAMLTGHAPHQNDSNDQRSAQSVLASLSKITGHEPTPIRQLRADVDPDLETICLKCLEIDPRQRFNSAEALLDELARKIDEEPIQTRRLSLMERFRRWQGLILGATLKSGDMQTRDIRLQSSKRVMGWPLIDVAYGHDRLASAENSLAKEVADEYREDVESLQVDAETVSHGRARGVFAFGNQAIGVVAMGNRAYGLIAIGRRAFGLIALGWTTFGIVSIGFLSFGVYALGGIAIGYHAAGIIAIGFYAWGALISLGWHAAGSWPWSLGGESVDTLDLLETETLSPQELPRK